MEWLPTTVDWSVAMLTIEAINEANAREEQVLRGIIDRLLDKRGEFYSTELVDAWIFDSKSTDPLDRRTAFNTVQRLLRKMEDGGELISRFQQKQGKGSGIGRKYYKRPMNNVAHLVECKPYNAKVTERTCVSRYSKAQKILKTAPIGNAAMARHSALEKFKNCVNCAEGRERSGQ
jgi:hypothetical protein